MKILVTGSNGFIGKNLISHLSLNHEVIPFTRKDDDLKEKCLNADIVFHLAAENRPQDINHFQSVNVGLTKRLTDILTQHYHSIPIIFTSTMQVALDNPYGISKKEAETILKEYHEKTYAPVLIYRLPGVFGKWSKPYYNTVVATFIDQVLNDKPLTIHDPKTMIELVYIDDVIKSLINNMDKIGLNYERVTPMYQITLKELSDHFLSFKRMEETLFIPFLEDGFIKKLYSTYTSFKKEKALKRSLITHKDERGSFTELLKQSNFGQVSINITKPGITKGDHYHHHKHEKFIVVAGEGLITIRDLFDETIQEILVSGTSPQIVDIPPGSAHAIKNTGDSDLVTVMWANEPFDESNPDTYKKKVK